MIRYKKSIMWQGKRKLITLTLEEYQNILQRYDPRNARRSINRRIIEIGCLLCKKHHEGFLAAMCSSKCPFQKFRNPDGCLKLLKANMDHGVLKVKLDKVWWMNYDHAIALEELAKVRDWLKSFKRVET